MALRLVRTWLPIWSQAVFDLPKELRPTYLKGRPWTIIVESDGLFIPRSSKLIYVRRYPLSNPNDS